MQKCALLIGIDQYSNCIQRLYNAVRDVRSVAQVLSTLHGYEVHLLEDGQATRASIEHSLEEIASRLRADARFLVYFAGHGIAEDLFGYGEGDQGFILTYEADPTEPASFWPMAALHTLLGRVACSHLFLVLDCCFAGAFRWTQTRSVMKKEKTLFRERYDRYLRDPAWQVLTSTAHDETALDRLQGQTHGSRGDQTRGSPFANALCQGLAGAADFAVSGPGDGVILASELHLYIEEEMKRLEQRSGRGQQRPMLWAMMGKEKGQFVFEVPGRSPDLPMALDLNEQNNPYRGLQPYGEEDYRLFFGREDEVQRLCDRVVRQPLTIVLGASGVGKSSLVQAGLLPRLRVMSEPLWHVLNSVRPGREPMRAMTVLLKELDEIASTPVGETTQPLRERNPKRHTLLIVDQLDELVAFGHPESILEQFILTLLATRSAHPQLHIVFTLRSDFAPHFDRLLRESQGSLFLVHSMKRIELRTVIERPAVERVLFFEPPSLIERVLDDVSETPGALPLLSFTLSEMYRAYLRSGRGDRSLTSQDYEALGGISGALRRCADDLYDNLDSLQQSTLEWLLLRMVSLEVGEVARRRVPLTELDFGSGTSAQAHVQKVLRFLQEARLVIAAQDGAGDSYIELAHDKLALGWPRLWSLLRREQENLPLWRRLTRAARDWATAGRGETWLWAANPLLPLMFSLFKREPERFNLLEQKFLELSQEKAARDAEELRQQLLSTYVEQGRQLLIRGKPMPALLWLSRAYKEGSKDSSLRFMLAQATQSINGLAMSLKGHGGEIQSVALSRDGGRIVTASKDSTAKVWDLPTGKLLHTLAPLGNGVLSATASFNPDGNLILTADDNAAKLWDSRTGKLLLIVYEVSQPLTAAVFSPDGARVLTASEGWDAKVWDVRTGALVAELKSRHMALKSGAFSPDGKRVITAGESGNAVIWLADSGSELVAIDHGGMVRTVVFHPNGTQVATSGDRDGVVKLWNADTGKLLAVLEGHQGLINSVEFSADGSQILTSSDDRTARLWNASTGKIIVSMQGHQDAVCSARFNPASEQIITASADGSAKLWDALSGKPLESLEGHQGSVKSAIFSLDGTQVITIGSDGLVNVWNTGANRQLACLRGRELTYLSMFLFSPDESNIALYNYEENFVRIWNISAGKWQSRLTGHSRDILSLAFNPDGSRIVTGSADQTTKVWEVASGNLLMTLSGCVSSISAVVVHPGGAQIATGGYREATLWDAATGQMLHSLDGHRGVVRGLAYSQDGSILATANDGDNTARLWDAKAGRLILSIAAEVSNLFWVFFSPDGRYLVTEDRHNRVKIWETASGKPPAFLRQIFEKDIVTSIEFSLDAHRMLLMRLYGNPELWDLREGRRVATLEGHQGRVLSMTHSSDGTRIITGGQDRTAKIWDSANGKMLMSLEGHDDDVNSVAANLAGTLLVTASDDGTARIWDLQKGVQLSSFEGHAGPILSARFSPDGARVVTRGQDGTVRIWDTRSEQRSPQQIEDLVRCRVPLRLAGVILQPAERDPQACT